MKYYYSNAVFLKCESCSERTHCKQCGMEWSQLLEENGASHAVVDTEAKTIQIETQMDEDDFLDYAEGLGIFV